MSEGPNETEFVKENNISVIVDNKFRKVKIVFRCHRPQGKSGKDNWSLNKSDFSL